jgi:hypothetical protein
MVAPPTLTPLMMSSCRRVAFFADDSTTFAFAAPTGGLAGTSICVDLFMTEQWDARPKYFCVDSK